MNTANLQIEGLLVAMSTVLREGMKRGFIHQGQVTALLDAAEAHVTLDGDRRESVTPAQLDAICFPIRYLRVVATRPDHELRFSDIAAEVGRIKPSHS